MNSLRRLNIIFEVSLHLLLFIPFAMLAVGGAVGTPLTIAFGVLVVLSWPLHKGVLSSPDAAKWWSAGTLTFVVFAGVRLVVSEESILTAGVRLVLVLVLVKLFSRRGGRDELQLYLLSFVMLAAATTVNEDLVFGVLFSLYVLLGTFSLAVFHLKEELSAHPRLVMRGVNPLNRQYMGVLAAMSGVILLLSVGIFFAFPRVGMGFFEPQMRSTSSMTGFSESVELGSHGLVRTNPDIVMRVEFPDGKAREESYHWRMMTFDHYDGKRWTRTLPKMSRPIPYAQDRSRALDLDSPVDGPLTQMQIYLEPLDTALLPTVWPAHSMRLGSGWIKAPGTSFEFSTPKKGRVTIDLYGDVRHASESQVGVPYSLWVGHPSGQPPKRQRGHQEAFEQLPQSFTPRAKVLARQVVGDARTPADKAERLQRHLQTAYTYTLDLPDVGDNPIDGFLFEAKRGHCEYFATSMVLMLRAVGVRARLVNGFLGGQWNSVGGFLAVRQGNAHSWVEYDDPKTGWTPVDPTPAIEILPQNRTVDRLRQYYDAAQLVWMKWVIEYDLAAQIKVFENAMKVFRPDGLLKGAAKAQQEQSAESEVDVDWRLVYLLMLGGFCVVTFVRTRRRFQQNDSTKLILFTVTGWVVTAAVTAMFLDGWTPQTALIGGGSSGLGAILAWVFRQNWNTKTAASNAFGLVEHAAAKSALVRGIDEGPAAFLDRVAQQKPAARGAIRAFSKLYLKLRFSQRAPVASEVQTLREVTRAAVSALRR